MSEKDEPQFAYPKAVQDQIDRNLAALNPAGEAAEGAGAPDPGSERTATSSQRPAEESRKAAEKESPPAQKEQPVKADPAPDENWEKRYKGYKQSTDSTLFELRTALSQKDEEMQRLQQQMGQMQEYLRKQPAPQQQADMPSDLKDKLKQLYGDEDLDAMQALAKHVASKELASRDRVIVDLRNQIQYLMSDTQNRHKQLQQQADQQVFQTFESRLGEMVPRWTEIDNSPAYIRWMERPDPASLSGKSRKEMMATAYKNGSVADVARHYREYMSEQGLDSAPKTDPRLNTTLPRSNRAAEPQTSRPQENILAPGRYQTMVREKTLGRISAEEFGAFEKQYFQALRGGRAA